MWSPPALRQVPHITSTQSYDGAFYAARALDPLVRDPAVDRVHGLRPVPRAPCALQLDGIRSRSRPPRVDSPGVRAPERRRLAAARPAAHALARRRYAARTGALGGMSLFSRAALVRTALAAGRTESAGDCDGGVGRRGGAPVPLCGDCGDRRTGARNERDVPRRRSRRREPARVAARIRAGADRGAARPHLDGLPLVDLSEHPAAGERSPRVAGRGIRHLASAHVGSGARRARRHPAASVLNLPLWSRWRSRRRMSRGRAWQWRRPGGASPPATCF